MTAIKDAAGTTILTTNTQADGSVAPPDAIPPDTATRKTRLDADTTVKDVAANTSRKGLQFRNTSTSAFYITYASAGTPSQEDCDIELQPGEIWWEPIRYGGVYTGAYRAVSAASVALTGIRVVEFI